MHRVRGDVGVRHEDSKFNQEHRGCGNGVFGVLMQRTKGKARAGLFVERESGAQEETCERAQHRADKGDDANRPGKADLRRCEKDYNRENHAAQTTGCTGDPCCEAASDVEPVADGGDGWGEERAGGEAAEDAEGEHNLVVLCPLVRML